VKDDPDVLKRFQQEARTLAALNHPKVAAIHGLEDHSFLVLELVEGETLADRLDREGRIVLDRQASRSMARAYTGPPWGTSFDRSGSFLPRRPS
jgi:serine/threonine protein kinase